MGSQGKIGSSDGGRVRLGQGHVTVSLSGTPRFTQDLFFSGIADISAQTPTLGKSVGKQPRVLHAS